MTRQELENDGDSATSGIPQTQPLTLIVGEHRISPCDHETYRLFKIWAAKTHADGTIDVYRAGNVSITHWDDRAADRYPHLLNPCECGAFLPIEVEPGPMLGSAVGLLSDLNQLKSASNSMPLEFDGLVTAMMQMAEESLATNKVLEIR